jgi:hypothetical protein
MSHENVEIPISTATASLESLSKLLSYLAYPNPAINKNVLRLGPRYVDMRMGYRHAVAKHGIFEFFLAAR